MAKLTLLQPGIERVESELTNLGFDEFKVLNQALVKIRKSQISNSTSLGYLDWYFVVERAKAINEYCLTLKLNPTPILLALLYWQQVLLVDGEYKHYPTNIGLEAVLAQLKDFGYNEPLLNEVVAVLSHADCFGCDHEATPHARVFGLAQFFSLEPELDSLRILSSFVEWSTYDASSDTVKDAFAEAYGNLRTILKHYNPAHPMLVKLFPESVQQAVFALHARIEASNSETAYESLVSEGWVLRVV